MGHKVRVHMKDTNNSPQTVSAVKTSHYVETRFWPWGLLPLVPSTETLTHVMECGLVRLITQRPCKYSVRVKSPWTESGPQTQMDVL